LIVYSADGCGATAIATRNVPVGTSSFMTASLAGPAEPADVAQQASKNASDTVRGCAVTRRPQ
jgi:hypothetical protein